MLKTMKRCTKCGQNKSVLKNFYKRSDRPNTYQSHCKKCRAEWAKRWFRTPAGKQYRKRLNVSRRTIHKNQTRRSSAKYKYGLSTKQFNSLMQEKFCELCGCEFSDKKRPSIDHDHTTGIIRGLLCQPCNAMLGRLCDDPRVFRKVADYLEGHRKHNIVPETTGVLGVESKGKTPSKCRMFSNKRGRVEK
jgi:hypothetical protein